MSSADIRSTAGSAFGQNRELIDLESNNLDLRLAPLPGAWAARTGLCRATT
jgi:hypothetical protein